MIRIFCIVLFTSLSATAQVKLNEFFKNMKPRAIGPAGMSGRITAIDAVVHDPNIIYLGAASGGVWKTENGGASWNPIFDDQPILNIGSLAIQQSNPAVVWAGTGEGNPRNSINLGEGIYKSLDAGKSWKRMGLEKTKNIHRIIIDPANPNTVFAGVIGNPFAEHPERGVFKTMDGGENWKKVLYTNDTSGVGDMIMDPSNPNKLLVAMWQHRRTPWSMQSGGQGSGLYLTYDGGTTWKKLGKESGLPEGNFGRIGLAASRSNPNRIYALVEATKNGLYRSDDGGITWELVNNQAQWVTNRPFYFQDIAVDPENENRVYLIYQMISVSEDGGKSFNVLLPFNGIHPDHHAFWIHPQNGKFIIDGNDGGIGISRDRGKTWQFDDKIPIGQFYHINVDNAIPYNVMGGMQDNGSWIGPAYTWINGGIKNYYWQNLMSGDGFDVMPDPVDHRWVYAMSQGGSVGRVNIETGERWNIKPPSPELKTTLRFNWNAAIAQDPFDANTIYFGSQYVHSSPDKGVSWNIISTDLTTNDSNKIDQTNNGGLSIDITGAENFCTILTIAPSAKEKDVIWVGTDDGNVQLTRDGGITWTNFRGKIPGLPAGAWIPQIVAGRHNSGEAFVVANDYRRGDFKPYVFRTQDYGKTWTRMVDEKKVIGYSLCILQDPTEPNLIFTGTEQGLFVSFDNGATFQQWTNGYPSVSTYDLALQEREADLVIATFGRSIYVLDDIRPLRALAKAKGKAAKVLQVIEAPTAYQATFKTQPGYEWSTFGLFDAENRRNAAWISYIYQPTVTKTTEALKKARQDTAIVAIYNSENENIRNLRWKMDTGFNRNAWNMDEKGVRSFTSVRPSRAGVEPSGWQVLPGRYKVVISFGSQRDSTFVEIKDDPRIGDRNNVKREQRVLLLKLRTEAEKLAEGMEHLAEAEDAVKKMEAYLKDVPGLGADSLRKSGSKILDSIRLIREFVVGASQTRQGYGAVPTITVANQYQQAVSYISSKPFAPGKQEQMLADRSQELMKQAKQRINSFFATTWSQYRKLAESQPVKLFKEYSPI